MRLAGALVWHWRRGDPYEGRAWLQKVASVTEAGTRNVKAAETGGSTDGSADPGLLELLGWRQAGAAGIPSPTP